MKIRMFSVMTACAVVGVLSVSAFTGTSRASVIIDDFTDVEDPAAWPIELFAEGSSTLSESGLNTLGGTRQTYIEATSIGIPDVDFVEVNISTSEGLFRYFSSSDAEGFVSLLYDGGGSLNADFSQQTAVWMHFNQFDFANGNPLPITLILSDGINTASHTVSLISAGAQTAIFDLAMFAGIDLASIQSIEFELDPGVAADFQIDYIRLVPTPGALMLLGIAGLAGVRRRRD